MHHFPFHVNDFSRDTARFDLVEIGIFLRLLMEYYSSEKPLPNDHNELAFRVGARTRPEKCALDHVLRRCFELDSVKNEYVQKRCEAEILNYRAAGVQSRYANLCRHWEKVNKGVEKPRFETFAQNPDSYFDETTGRVRQVTGRSSLVLVSESEDSPALPLPDSQPRTKNQEPRTIDTPIVPKGTNASAPTEDSIAEAIYALYPNKVGKPKAKAAILKALKATGLTELEMQAKVRAYAAAVSTWPADERRFVPMPATWFNQHRFNDDASTWTRTPASSPTGFGLQKNGGGRAAAAELNADDIELGVDGVDDEPLGWVAAWQELYEGTAPDWPDVPETIQQRILQWLDTQREKNEGGAA